MKGARHMRVFCLGDSLTAGYGVRAEECWRALAARMTGFELIDGGVNGDTTWSMRFRFDRVVLPARPDLLFLLGGGNDMLHGDGGYMARVNYEEIARGAAKAGLPLMVGLPCPFVPELAREFWSPDIDYDESLFSLEDWVRWLRGRAPAWGAPVCDFWSLFETLPPERRRDIYIDGLHPKPEGHRLMAQAAAAALRAFTEGGNAP